MVVRECIFKTKNLRFSTALQDKSRINTFLRQKETMYKLDNSCFSIVIECSCLVYDVNFVMEAYGRVLL